MEWIKLTVQQPQDFKDLFIQIYKDKNIMRLYNKRDSYIWQFKKQIFTLINTLEQIKPHVQLDNEIIRTYKEWAKS